MGEEEQRRLTEASSAGARPSNFEFDAPQPDWLELWQGPLQHRATYDKGQFGPGHSLERINQHAIEGATGGGRHQPIYSVKVDPADGAVVIDWLIGLPGEKPPFQSVRWYEGGPGRGMHERLGNEEAFRDLVLAHLPHDQRRRAVGAFASGVTIREWIESEFFQALSAGWCEIWARIGSRAAPFRRVPPDIFAAYQIRSWGYGVPGGAWAELQGAEPLYSIRVAASEQYLSHLEAEKSVARLTHEETVQWCRDWMASGKGNGMDKAYATFKKLPSASGCARDTFFRPAWTEAKTKAAN
jgi:hypothetical protein